MANQFTKGTRTKHDEATKDRIRAEQLAQRLYKFAKAKGEKVNKLRMDNAQVAAAKVLIERGKPALQSIEQKIIEEPKSDQEMQEQLAHLLSDNPSLLKRLFDSSPGLRAAIQSLVTGSPSVVDTQQRSAA